MTAYTWNVVARSVSFRINTHWRNALSALATSSERTAICVTMNMHNSTDWPIPQHHVS